MTQVSQPSSAMRRKSSCRSQLPALYGSNHAGARASRRRWCPPARPAARRPAKRLPAGGPLSSCPLCRSRRSSSWRGPVRRRAARPAPPWPPRVARQQHGTPGGQSGYIMGAEHRRGPAATACAAKSWPSACRPGRQTNSAPGPAQRESQQTDVISVRASPRRSRQPVFWVSRRRSIQHHAPKNCSYQIKKLYTHQICRQQSPPCRCWFNILCSARGSKNSAAAGRLNTARTRLV